MSWYVWGSAREVNLGIRESGELIAWGGGAHEANPPARTSGAEFYDAMARAECDWTVVPSDASDIEIDAAGQGLLAKVKEFPGQPHVMIRYFANESPLRPAMVGFHIVLPPRQMGNAIELFKTVLLHEQIGFLLSIDFIGFRAEGSSAPGPTSQQFLAGQPCLVSDRDIRFSIGRRFRDEHENRLRGARRE